MGGGRVGWDQGLLWDDGPGRGMRGSVRMWSAFAGDLANSTGLPCRSRASGPTTRPMHRKRAAAEQQLIAESGCGHPTRAVAARRQ